MMASPSSKRQPPFLACILLLLASSIVISTNAFVINSLTNHANKSSSRLYATTKQEQERSKKRRASNLLTDWARNDAGIQMGGGVEVGTSELGGLGLIASQDLTAGQVVVTVPSSLALSVQVPGQSNNLPQEYFDSKSLQELSWFVQFSAYLHVLDLDKQKDNVDMSVWLDSLPRSFDTPLHWSKEARDELQYSFLQNAVSRQESEWKNHYETVKKSCFVDFSFEKFVWGAECARSRAFSGTTGAAFDAKPYVLSLLLVVVYVGLNLGTLEQAANGAAFVVCASILKDFVVPKLLKKQTYVICPYIDMANHNSQQTSAKVEFEFFGNAYSLVTSAEIPRNSELFISYGPRSNDQLLQYYGFCEANNPHDVYVMPPLREWNVDALEQATGRQFAPGRLEKLNRAGLLGSSSNENNNGDDDMENATANRSRGVVVTRAGGVDPAVMQALRALVSSQEEWTNAGEAIGNFAQEVGPNNERATQIAARTALELELESKPTTIQQDEELLKRLPKKGTDAEDVLAIQFRLEKKKLLEETIKALQ